MGGGVLRTAAKAAVLGGYRSAASAATRPPATSVAATSEVVPAAVSVTGLGPSAAASAVVQRAASWELDDWDFAGGKDEEVLFDSMNPPTRLVFGPPPTIEEAKAATADLKEALEIAYFSSSVDESQMSVQTTGALAAEHNGKASATNFDSAVIPSVPTHVMQAFSLLQGSTEAQDVVASLAADKNVWDAVMKNEKVMQFYMNHQSTVSPDERVSDYGENTTMHENENTEASLEDSDATSVKENSGNRISEFVTKIKMKVSKMVNNLTEFFQDIFGTSPAASSSTNTNTATADNVGIVFGSSFIALAVAAIIVVLLKRG